MTPELIISILSLIVAAASLCWSIWLSVRDKKKAEQLTELQIKLHEMQLQREEEAAQKRASSKVEAHHVLIGTKSHRIRIANTGGTPVTNVTCEYDKDDGPYVFMQDKEPYERLEPGESFDESILLVAGSPSKFHIKTCWIGADGEKHQRDNIVSC